MIRIGNKVICMHMPSDYGHPLKVGETYLVESMDENEQWLRVKGAPMDYETKYFRLADQSRARLFSVTVEGGHVYRIRCSDEAMKELAEFIGDDNLISVEPVTLKKKSA